ncbi:MAG: hypothetical protein HQK54_12995, partial [Oligoflexales bacterium]|nr:hypothetical protein [Oligoflexales bacterium]
SGIGSGSEIQESGAKFRNRGSGIETWNYQTFLRSCGAAVEYYESIDNSGKDMI